MDKNFNDLATITNIIHSENLIHILVNYDSAKTSIVLNNFANNCPLSTYNIIYKLNNTNPVFCSKLTKIIFKADPKTVKNIYKVLYSVNNKDTDIIVHKKYPEIIFV